MLSVGTSLIKVDSECHVVLQGRTVFAFYTWPCRQQPQGCCPWFCRGLVLTVFNAKDDVSKVQPRLLLGERGFCWHFHHWTTHPSRQQVRQKDREKETNEIERQYSSIETLIHFKRNRQPRFEKFEQLDKTYFLIFILECSFLWVLIGQVHEKLLVGLLDSCGARSG